VLSGGACDLLGLCCLFIPICHICSAKGNILLEFGIWELDQLYSWKKQTCPGFGQDRVKFHQKPERGTARQADPTWPNRAGYSIPCAIMLGSGWGSWAVGRQSRLGSTHGSGR